MQAFAATAALTGVQFFADKILNETVSEGIGRIYPHVNLKDASLLYLFVYAILVGIVVYAVKSIIESVLEKKEERNERI